MVGDDVVVVPKDDVDGGAVSWISVLRLLPHPLPVHAQLGALQIKSELPDPHALLLKQSNVHCAFSGDNSQVNVDSLKSSLSLCASTLHKSIS